MKNQGSNPSSSDRSSLLSVASLNWKQLEVPVDKWEGAETHDFLVDAGCQCQGEAEQATLDVSAADAGRRLDQMSVIAFPAHAGEWTGNGAER